MESWWRTENVSRDAAGESCAGGFEDSQVHEDGPRLKTKVSLGLEGRYKANGGWCGSRLEAPCFDTVRMRKDGMGKVAFAMA